MSQYRILWGHGGSPVFEAASHAEALDHANQQSFWRQSFMAIYGASTFKLRDLQMLVSDQWGNSEWVAARGVGA